MERIITPVMYPFDTLIREIERIAKNLRLNPFAERRTVITYDYGDIEWDERGEEYTQESIEIPRKRRVYYIKKTPFMCTDRGKLCEMVDNGNGVLIRAIKPNSLDSNVVTTLVHHITAR